MTNLNTGIDGLLVTVCPACNGAGGGLVEQYDTKQVWMDCLECGFIDEDDFASSEKTTIEPDITSCLLAEANEIAAQGRTTQTEDGYLNVMLGAVDEINALRGALSATQHTAAQLRKMIEGLKNPSYEVNVYGNSSEGYSSRVYLNGICLFTSPQHETEDTARFDAVCYVDGLYRAYRVEAINAREDVDKIRYLEATIITLQDNAMQARAEADVLRAELSALKDAANALYRAALHPIVENPSALNGFIADLAKLSLPR